MVSFCFCAKLRTCACANLMSSRSRLATCEMALLDLRRRQPEVLRRPIVEFLGQLADRGVLSFLDLRKDTFHRLAHLGVGGLDRARVHPALEPACHRTFLRFVSAATSFAVMPGS